MTFRHTYSMYQNVIIRIELRYIKHENKYFNFLNNTNCYLLQLLLHQI